MSVDSWRSALRTIPTLWPELHVTKCRQDVMTRHSGSASGGAPIVYRFEAAEVQDAIRGLLQSILITFDRESGGAFRYRSMSDLILDCTRNASWIDRHAGSEEWFATLRDLIADGWRAVDRPPDLIRVGLCEAPLADSHETCTAELWSEPEQLAMTCPLCGAAVDVAGRRDASINRVAAARVPLSIAVKTLSDAGVKVTLEQARNWTKRKDKHGRLLLTHVAERKDRTRLYRLGDVQELASRRRTATRAKARAR